MNALWNCTNPNQGEYTRVLAVCSAGLLRSATIAWYLTKYSDANVRNAGIHDYALVPVDEVLLEWADVIICSDKEKVEYLQDKYPKYIEKPVFNFDLDDIYPYRDPELINVIKDRIEHLKLGEYILGLE